MIYNDKKSCDMSNNKQNRIHTINIKILFKQRKGYLLESFSQESDVPLKIILQGHYIFFVNY